jgi:hypothetical protein
MLMKYPVLTAKIQEFVPLAKEKAQNGYLMAASGFLITLIECAQVAVDQANVDNVRLYVWGMTEKHDYYIVQRQP